MRAWASRSLVRRLTWLGLLLLGCTLLASGLGLGAVSYFAVREHQVTRAEQAAELLAEFLAPAMAFEDAKASGDLLRSFGGRGDLVELQAWSADHRLFGQWLMPGGQPFAWDGQQAERRVDGDGLLLVKPVRLRGETIGWLVWRERFHALHVTLWRMAWGGVLVFAAVMGMAGWLLSWSQRRALQPLVALSRMAEQASATQDYSLRAPVLQRDEVGRLAQRFNELMRRIEIWHADLHEQLREEQRTGQRMQELAHRDALTGLANRLAFDLALERQVVELQRIDQAFVLIFADLDGFKAVNDQLGHAAGDQVLVEVSRRMGKVLRSRDLLCRLGGDEFGLLLPELRDLEQTVQLARRLNACLDEPVQVEGRSMPIGASLGVAMAPLHGRDAQSLLAAADAAMYAAKRAGKNTFRMAEATDPVAADAQRR